MNLRQMIFCHRTRLLKDRAYWKLVEVGEQVIRKADESSLRKKPDPYKPSACTPVSRRTL